MELTIMMKCKKWDFCATSELNVIYLNEGKIQIKINCGKKN